MALIGLALIAGAGAFAVAVPAAANPVHSAHPSHPADLGQPSISHKCAAHGEA
jgi:hypothetical protein